VRGQYYYLYLIEDIYSRKGVWVGSYTAPNLAKTQRPLLQRSILVKSACGEPLVLHSDNGAPHEGLRPC